MGKINETNLEDTLLDKVKKSVKYVDGKFLVETENGYEEVEIEGGGNIVYPDVTLLNMTSSDDGTLVTALWNNPSNPELLRIELYVANVDLSGYTIENISSVATKVIIDKPGTSYTKPTNVGEQIFIKVFAVHTNFSEMYSKGVTSSIVAKDTKAPSSVSNLAAATEDSKVNLSWTNPTDDDFNKVVVRYKTGSYPTSITDGQLAYEGSSTSVPVVGLTNDVVHYFRTFTVDNSGNINNSSSQITATPTGKDDLTGSPGPGKLVAGDMTAGYFGLVPASELFTGTQIASTVGISVGTLQHDTTPWMKFAIDGKIIFTPQKPIRNNLSWDHINAANAVNGSKTVNKNGINYKVRLFKGALTNPSKDSNSDRGAKGSEWNRLMLPIHEQARTKAWAYPDYVESNVPDWGIGFTDADLWTRTTHGTGSYTWCQESITSNASFRVIRGGNGVSLSYWYASSHVSSGFGWRPVLEI